MNWRHGPASNSFVPQRVRMMKHLPQLPPLTNKLISKKKVAFPVTASLQAYLDQHGRALNIPVTYEDLLRFEGSMAILDKPHPPNLRP